MIEKITPPDLQQTDTLLSDLFKEVQKWEGSLAGGTKLGVGAEAINNLLETKVSFGNPKDRLILLTEETFKNSGTELNDIYKQQMRDQYEFYYMIFSVDLIPKAATRFWRLTCQLDFTPKGEQEPIVQAIFPTDKWRAVMNFGVGMDVSLNGNLDWIAGVDSSQLPAFTELLPGELKANVVNKDEFKGFITIPAFKYELGHPEILAVGENNSFCYWRIQDQELQKVGTAKFSIVFKVPKDTESINLEGIAWAEPKINWLAAEIGDVLKEIPFKFRSLLSQDAAASKLARVAVEKWTLNLPHRTIDS
ncbi:hypothetical protein [Microcoleus sp. B9-D4]|uniref:hypothetical protein n=1 Tax=Microcoleus sp. B9-D4 TaxID=2818711 RepID=UPI002FD43085